MTTTAPATGQAVGTPLRLVIRPGLDAMARVVAVVHARRLPVERLEHDVASGRAALWLSPVADVERTALQLARLVDVRAVSMGGSR